MNQQTLRAQSVGVEPYENPPRITERTVAGAPMSDPNLQRIQGRARKGKSKGGLMLAAPIALCVAAVGAAAVYGLTRSGPLGGHLATAPAGASSPAPDGAAIAANARTAAANAATSADAAQDSATDAAQAANTTRTLPAGRVAPEQTVTARQMAQAGVAAPAARHHAVAPNRHARASSAADSGTDAGATMSEPTTRTQSPVNAPAPTVQTTPAPSMAAPVNPAPVTPAPATVTPVQPSIQQAPTTTTTSTPQP